MYVVAWMLLGAGVQFRAPVLGLIGGFFLGLGFGLIGLGICIPIGLARFTPELGSMLTPRFGRAQVRAIAPLMIGSGVVVVFLGAIFAFAREPSEGATLAALGAFGAGAALWLSLYLAGVPRFLMPRDFQLHGPRRLWDPLPPLDVYRRPGFYPEELDRFRGAAGASARSPIDEDGAPR